MTQQINQFHHTAAGYIVFMLAEAAVTYGMASLAIDRGSPVYYLLFLIFLIGTLKNFINLIKKLFKWPLSKAS